MSTTRKTSTRATTPTPEPADDLPLTPAEAAYRLHADEPDDKVRARARRAAHGEAIRATRDGEAHPLPVRDHDGAGRIRTEAIGRLLPSNVRGQVDVRRIDR